MTREKRLVCRGIVIAALLVSMGGCVHCGGTDVEVMKVGNLSGAVSGLEEDWKSWSVASAAVQNSSTTGAAFLEQCRSENVAARKVRTALKKLWFESGHPLFLDMEPHAIVANGDILATRYWTLLRAYDSHADMMRSGLALTVRAVNSSYGVDALEILAARCNGVGYLAAAGHLGRPLFSMQDRRAFGEAVQMWFDAEGMHLLWNAELGRFEMRDGGAPFPLTAVQVWVAQQVRP